MRLCRPKEIVERAAVPSGRAADRERLDDAARTVWADGYFDSVVYRLDPGPDGSAALVIEPKEKRAGYSSARLGGSLETDFDSVVPTTCFCAQLASAECMGRRMAQ